MLKFLIIALFLFPLSLHASFWQGEWYSSWGYNRVMWSHTDIRIQHEGMGNDFTFNRVSGHDDPAFDLIEFNPANLTLPQYSIRIGHIYNEEKQLGWELNYEHYKFVADRGQRVWLSGTKDHQQVGQWITLNDDVLFYKLNNGANLLLLNWLKRIPLHLRPNDKYGLAFLLKAGAGVMIPHTQNSVFGRQNKKGFQFGGYGTGIESGLRFVPWSHTYLEFGHKIALLRYSKIHTAMGDASHSFFAQSFALSMGFFFGHSPQP